MHATPKPPYLAAPSGLKLSCHTYPGRCPGLPLVAPLVLKPTVPLAVPDPGRYPGLTLVAPLALKTTFGFSAESAAKASLGQRPRVGQRPRNVDYPSKP